MELIRYSPPSRYDLAPYGFIVKVLDDKQKHSYYIQTSTDQELPSWQTIGSFLEEVFTPYMENQDFIEVMLHIHKNKPILETFLKNLK